VHAAGTAIPAQPTLFKVCCFQRLCLAAYVVIKLCDRCAEVQSELLAALREADLTPQDPDAWVLARYNDPSVKPRFRRNEILMQLKDFDLWQ
jgi:hypothetical protein